MWYLLPFLDGVANLEQVGDVMAVAGLLKLFLVRRKYYYNQVFDLFFGLVLHVINYSRTPIFIPHFSNQ